MMSSHHTNFGDLLLFTVLPYRHRKINSLTEDKIKTLVQFDYIEITFKLIDLNQKLVSHVREGLEDFGSPVT